MGYDVYTRAVVGYVVPQSAITVEQKVRGCNHKTDESKKFCSECGKPVWVKKELHMFDDDDSFHVMVGKRAFEVKVHGYGGDHETYAIGLASNYTGRYGSEHPNDEKINIHNLPEDLNAFAQALKDELAEKQIEVDIEDFGFYTVVTHSY